MLFVPQPRALDKREYLMMFDGYFFSFLNETICCDPSSEPSQRDGSDDGSQLMVLCRIIKIYPQLSSNTPSYLELCHNPPPKFMGIPNYHQKPSLSELC